MAATDIDIVARACVLLGIKPISSFTGTDDKTTTCKTIYPMVKDEVLSRYPWRFTTVKRRLVRLEASPTNEWQYAFQLPSDRLGGPRAVFNSGDVGAATVKEYDVYQDHLYANDASIWIDYQVSQNEAKFPPYVTHLMVLVAAARLAEPLTDDSSKGDKWEVAAFGMPSELGEGGYYQTAKKLDVQQRPPQEASGDYSLIAVR